MNHACGIRHLSTSRRASVRSCSVMVRCPGEYDELMRRAGGVWEPGARQWLVERRRIGPVIREPERTTDPLFRRVDIHLEG